MIGGRAGGQASLRGGVFSRGYIGEIGSLAGKVSSSASSRSRSRSGSDGVLGSGEVVGPGLGMARLMTMDGSVACDPMASMAALTSVALRRYPDAAAQEH